MTALALTAQPSTGSVQLAITGAPILTPAYTQGTGIDGWAVGAVGTIAAGGPTGTHTGAEGFSLTRPSANSPNAASASKTIAGLTVGQKYRYTAWVNGGTSLFPVKAWITVPAISVSSSIVNLSGTGWVQIAVTFTATLTSHQLVVQASGGTNRTAVVYFDDIALVPYATNPTTTVTRTDANGTSRAVRRLDGQEPVSGSMTLVDYEAAFTGTLSYSVTDTSGVTVTQTTNLNAVANPWLTVVTKPSTISAKLDALTDYRAAREFLGTIHRPVGRPYPLIVTGPLGSREGALTARTADYAAALALVDVVEAGETLMVRQPTYAGLDMYLVATTARLSPAVRTAAGWRWDVDLEYIELDLPADPLAA